MISKKYFKYLFKTLLPIAIVYIAVSVFSYAIFPWLSNSVINTLSSDEYQTISYIGTLMINSFLPMVISMALPLIIHNRYYSKNSSDIYLSLPLSRKQAF